MPSSLPSESAVDKAVNTFGLGTYDSQSDNDGTHGEDSEKSEPEGESLPQDGGPLDPFGPDRLLGYPQEYTSQGKHSSDNGPGWLLTKADFLQFQPFTMANAPEGTVADVPGDQDRPSSGRRINDDTLQSVVESVSNSQLPEDDDNPAARSDYYDRMQTGNVDGSLSDIWPSEDSGAYVSQSQLPGVLKNEQSMDNFLGALGNYWSGYETEDVSNSQGFPSEDFQENIDYDRSDNQDGGKIMASLNNRTATDLALVAELTKEFVKEFGKKDLTRRHVMAFLTSQGRPQYLASDIIRCLKHNHKLVIPDVLDTFPVAKTASDKISLAGVRDTLVSLQLENIIDPETSCEFGRCAADISKAIGIIEKFEGQNG